MMEQQIVRGLSGRLLGEGSLGNLAPKGFRLVGMKYWCDVVRCFAVLARVDGDLAGRGS